MFSPCSSRKPQWRALSMTVIPISAKDSFVWLINDNPVAIAIVTHRMDKARLIAFGVLPDYRSQGLAKQC
ncbi:TPA: GNAT family N-acetyltransferase [Citrobacter farmeri]|uniref:GNAT family N-acetyltransferase n=1 Tax=Citrobacter farmeri TaxID=67824 RepID=UPI00232C753C|nr:GNAT family N-acetyltransferase [Citrobacter farmeri]MDB2164028.1 GNAT family N-acetyltransferase [Citrobacter farmeri]